MLDKNDVIKYRNLYESFLTKEELAELINYNFSENIRLDIIKDYFLLSCLTGLSIQELGQVDFKNFDTRPSVNSTDLIQVVLRTGNPEKELTISIASYRIFCKYGWKLPSFVISDIRAGVYEIGLTISKDLSIPIRVRRKFEMISYEYAFPTFCHLFLKAKQKLINICILADISPYNF